MAYKVGGTQVALDPSVPYLWGSADTTSTMTQTTTITTSGIQSSEAVAVGYGKVVIGDRRDDTNGNNAGAFYIYNTDGTGETKVTASDGAASDELSYPNALRIGNGKIVVGSSGHNIRQGAVYVYDLDGTNEVKITASDGATSDEFGCSVAVGCGKIVVGAFGDDDNGLTSGSAYIYDLDGTNEIKITPSDGAAGDEFGSGVAIGCGRIVVTSGENYNGASYGVAYIYDLLGNEIGTYNPTIGGSARTLGVNSSVDISSGRICIGNYNYDGGRGIAYLLDLQGNEITTLQMASRSSFDFFGQNVSIGSGRVFISCHLNDDNGSQSGSVLIYDLNGNLIQQINGASGEYYGRAIAISNGIAVVRPELTSAPTYIYSTPQVYTVWDAIDLQYG